MSEAPVLTRERAGVLVIQAGHVALIHRVRDGVEYWVFPGGGIEPHETAPEAAAREAYEELGVKVRIGPLRIVIDHRSEVGWKQRQYYFEGASPTAEIQVVGPELAHGAERGSYTAVWLPLEELLTREVLPRAFAASVLTHYPNWPAVPLAISEA